MFSKPDFDHLPEKQNTAPTEEPHTALLPKEQIFHLPASGLNGSQVFFLG